MIYCLSQLHTGTQTSIAWLNRAPEASGLMLSTGVYNAFEGGTNCITHEWESGEVVEEFGTNTIYHEHVRGDHQSPMRLCRTQLIMATLLPTLIPIRDPLACLMSYVHRAELEGRYHTKAFKPLQDVIDRWTMMSEWFAHLRSWPKVAFVCWDQDPGENELAGVCRDLGIGTHFELLRPMARKIHNNDSGSYEMKSLYEAGDREALRNRIGVELFGYLEKVDTHLRPMLEILGYKDLMWWR